MWQSVGVCCPGFGGGLGSLHAKLGAGMFTLSLALLFQLCFSRHLEEVSVVGGKATEKVYCFIL